MFARDLIGNDSTVYYVFHTPAVRKNRVDSIISQIENISSVTSEMSGAAMCPYSPRANVTALLARGPTGGLFTGAPTDFSGADPAICRTLASPNLRTHQYDSRWVVFPILYDICRNLGIFNVRGRFQMAKRPAVRRQLRDGGSRLLFVSRISRRVHQLRQGNAV